MPATAQALLLVAAAGLTGSLLASSSLLLPLSLRQRLLPVLLAFALGALLGAAFFELLPHAIDELNGKHFEAIGQVFFLTIFSAFVLEKFLRWRQHAKPGLGLTVPSPAGPLVLVSDALHKFVDGLLVMAAFLTDPFLGVTTALAVVAHEIPQEVGILAILLNSGFRRLRAFLLKLLSSSAAIAGGVVGLFWLGHMDSFRPYVLVVAAALFSYVALGTLLPEIQRESADSAKAFHRVAWMQISAILIGGGIIFSLHHLAH